jgi:hypothetical protein
MPREPLRRSHPLARSVSPIPRPTGRRLHSSRTGQAKGRFGYATLMARTRCKSQLRVGAEHAGRRIAGNWSFTVRMVFSPSEFAVVCLARLPALVLLTELRVGRTTGNGFISHRTAREPVRSGKRRQRAVRPCKLRDKVGALRSSRQTNGSTTSRILVTKVLLWGRYRRAGEVKRRSFVKAAMRSRGVGFAFMKRDYATSPLRWDHQEDSLLPPEFPGLGLLSH